MLWGYCGLSLRKIEAARGARRETGCGYLKAAGMFIRTPGGRGQKAPQKRPFAPSVTTGSASLIPPNEVISGFYSPDLLKIQNQPTN